MQERRAPHQHVQVLRCHGGSLKFARRHGHIYIYDGELYIGKIRYKFILLFILYNRASYIYIYSIQYICPQNAISVTCEWYDVL